jgi:hypothetical protein
LKQVALLLLLSSVAGGDSTPPAPRDAPQPKAGADRCAKSSDCAFDCSAGRRCVARAAVTHHSAVKELPDDECRCVDGLCTRIAPSPAGIAPCRSDGDCTFDPARGDCVTAPSSPSSWGGPSCRCPRSSGREGRCVAAFAQPVQCTSWRDCSSYNGEPAPARWIPRGRGRVRPCKDGESDAICNQQNQCEIVRWKC